MDRVMNPNQYTQEWWLARRGKITGSRADRVVNGTERGWITLAQELAHESLMPAPPPEEERKPGAREHGHEYEEVAIADAAIRHGFDYERPGFRQHPKLDYVGVSSDFIVADWRGRRYNGEAKCPFNPEVHRQTWMGRQLPNRYKAQVQLEMDCWGLDYTMFISYCPMHIDHKSRGSMIIVPRDQNYIDYMLERFDKFQRTLMEYTEPSCQPVPKTLPRLF
jgi:predicted phage-related endonuclease